MNRSRFASGRAASQVGVAACLVVGLVGIAGASASAAPDAPNAALGYPSFRGADDPIPASGVTYDPTRSYLGAVYERDLAAGAGSDTDNDFWVDKLLARYGTAPDGRGTTDSGAEYGYDSDGNDYLFSRGRAAFLRTHKPEVLGFGGDLAYWDSINGRDGYEITLGVGGEQLTLTEDESQRKQTPSYWRSVFTTSRSGITVTQTKYITDANVLVTRVDISSDAATTIELSASSPLTSNIVGDELTGVFTAHNDVTTVRARFSGDDVRPSGSALAGELEVGAGQTATTKFQLGLTTPEIPESTTEYEAIATGDLRDADAAYTAHVTAYNAWWADNIPYIETPEHNIDKTLFYRWWLTRFNFLDANMPGNTLQFPTSIEGVLGYNNAIDLTIGMFIDDLKWLRDPSYSYGTWLSAGETAGGSGEFRDNPADPSNWDATHTQYIGQAAWQSYQVHGGPASVAELLAGYAAGDVRGQLAVNDSNGNDLLDTNWNAWTGNDADAVSFAERPGTRLDRAESAYVYAGAQAAAAAYRVAGDEDKAVEMDGYAARVKKAVVDTLWNDDAELIEHTFANGPAAGQFAKWKEVNNYYPYAVGLMPAPGDADYDADYASALRLFADADEYPVFPFFTANQADKAESGEGTNNFSVINSTVIFRIYQAALRQYDAAENGYITPEQFKQLLYWNAFSHYQGGDNRYPDQNEFWAGGSAADGGSISYRSWIHHTQLGTTNWTVIEDVAGLRPREDDKIELDPIALPGWGHFTVNNVSYHGTDVSIVWNGDGTYTANGAPEGYSLYVDGERAFTTDALAHVVYDPATGDVEVQDDSAASVTASAETDLPGASDVGYDSQSRVVDLLAKAGRNIDPAAGGAANVALGAGVEATSQRGGDARAAATVTDGTTVAQRFWAPETSDAEPALTLDFGAPTTIDDLRLFFYQTSSSTTAQGFAEPSIYRLEYWDGAAWAAIPDQARTPVIPQPNLNRVQFPAITTQKVRAVFTPQPGRSVGVKEFQAFDTGIAAPPSTNAAPSVIAAEGASRGGAVRVSAIVKDDGLPSGELTSEWSVRSAPEGGTAVFEDARATVTTARFSVAGTYVLALTADDGERQGSDTITVDAVVGDGSINAAPDAAPSASYTASWNNIDAITDGDVLFSGGDNSRMWATWSGDRPASQWLQLDWTAPIPLTGASIAFWHDNPDANAGGGVAVPRGWKLQYWDAAGDGGAGAWRDVVLADGASYERAADAVNEVRFDEVVTSKLRATFDANTDGSSYAAVGVSEFEALAPDPVVVDAVDVATTVGTQPTLPATVSAVYANGARRDLPVEWPAIDASQLAQEGEFELAGTVTAASSPATVTVWVRSDLAPSSLTLNGTVAVTQSLRAGTQLQLPATVTGIYNNGIRRSGLPVVWSEADLAAVDVSRPGTYVVGGTATDTINPGQTASASASVTVTGDATAVDKSALQALVDANAGREQGTYTDESWAAFTAARDAAAATLADATATQAAVNSAVDALTTAITGLREEEPAPSVVSLTVTKAPSRVEYRIGEALDLAGLEVTASLSTGATEVLAADAYTVSGFDSATAGARTVTITLVANPSVTTAFQVQVTDPSAPGTGGGSGSGGSGAGGSGSGGSGSGGSGSGGSGTSGSLANTGGALGGTAVAGLLALLAIGGGLAAKMRAKRAERSS